METREYQPKTGQPCSCKRGQQRDNCPQCEGTGWVIDFRAIRERIDKVQTGIHWSTGKAWARVRGKLGFVEQWADTEAAAIDKCKAFIARHRV